jgi:HD-GYP domain-containing protein (c-di-GMP phosphodiesterase class II)
MMKYVGLAAGAASGALFLRERQRRLAAERLAAAVLETLLRAIDANDAETGGHVRRVARYALILAEAADLDTREQHNVERIALFHDIGKIHEALFDIIHEESSLTPEARQAVRTHPRLGAEVLTPLASFFPELSTGVLSHHERWDGTGYPRKLSRTAIPLAARIVSIADSFDAMTYHRRYRAAQTARQAADKLMAGRGTQFDPNLVDLFLSPPVFDQIIRAMRSEPMPEPRAVRARSTKPERERPEVSFRWRTTTPAPRALGRKLRRSP